MCPNVHTKNCIKKLQEGVGGGESERKGSEETSIEEKKGAKKKKKLKSGEMDKERSSADLIEGGLIAKKVGGGFGR